MLIGLLGKPSAGKSTFFQAATGVPVERAAYPFTTIKPNHGVGYIRIDCVEKEFNTKCNPRTGFCIESNRFVPVELMDVAGLVPGAHEGKGLGNQFLDDLRQADILIHILDVSGSTNEKGEKVSPGSYNPVNDIKFLEDELNYWFKSILDRNFKKLTREQNTTKLEEVLYGQFAGLKISKDAIIKTLNELSLFESRLENWTQDQLYSFCKRIRETGKPIIIAANKADLSTSKENISKLKKQFPDRVIIPCSAEAEVVLKGASKNQFVKYIPGDKSFEILKDLSQQQKGALDLIKDFIGSHEHGTGVQEAINIAILNVLNYIAIFPGGVNKLGDSKGRILPDVFLLPNGSTAKNFASTIHSDIAKNFIKAIDVRTKRPYGADHVLKHGDVLEIVFKK